MNEAHEIEWEECCVCDGKEKGDLPSTTKGIVTLARQFVEIWKNGLLPFDPAKIKTNYVVGEDGTEHPDFERVMLRKSAKYIITATFDIHHITWQGRKNHYKLRTRKLKWDNLVPFYVHLSAQFLVHLQVQQFPILFALYAVNMMPLRTFMLLGHFMGLNRN